MLLLNFENIFIQKLNHNLFSLKNSEANVLRLDAIHDIVSGNKFFKLKYYLQEAKNNNYTTIATFGGAFSNHIVATAFACKQLNVESIGIIRGEEPKQYSHTLQACKEFGMKLIFTERKEFDDKETIKQKFSNKNWYWINEGGYGIKGAEGAKDIFNWIDESYTHIVCTCGTGTMMAGLIKAAKPHQTIVGINVLKGYNNLIEDVKLLLTEEERKKKFIVMNDYHFGGYAKHPTELINFINSIWNEFSLPTDIVYTSKMMFAFFDLLKKDFFSPQSKIMLVHSGGLQGNFSLPTNTLVF
jgi:1-aminocyclopropane-1-carboxylate deaminase